VERRRESFGPCTFLSMTICHLQDERASFVEGKIITIQTGVSA
jgi:hypothetical protein